MRRRIGRAEMPEGRGAAVAFTDDVLRVVPIELNGPDASVN
jgi:hypothetical protein